MEVAGEDSHVTYDDWEEALSDPYVQIDLHLLTLFTSQWPNIAQWPLGII